MQIETKRIDRDNFEELKQALQENGMDARAEMEGSTLKRVEIFRYGRLLMIVNGDYSCGIRMPVVKKAKRWALHGKILAATVRVGEQFATEEEAEERKKAIEEVAPDAKLEIEEQEYEPEGFAEAAVAKAGRY